MTTATTTCPRCEGSGEVWNYAGDPDAGDLRACPDCLGRGEIPLRTPAATARRESAAPHGCTGADCATCGDDTPALVRYAVARLLRALLLPCAARIAATAKTAAEWHDVAVEAAAVSVATKSDRASATYHAAAMMEAHDVATAAATCAMVGGESVEAWRTHTRWCIADERNAATRGA